MMELLLQVLIAVALIALMMTVRLVAGRAIFRFRMNNGFRAHECDGTCRSHGQAAAQNPDKTVEFE